MMHDGADASPNITLVALLFEGGLALLALVLGWAAGQPPLENTDLSWSAAPRLAAGAAWGCAATLPMIVGLLVADRFPIGALRRVRRVVVDYVAPLFSRCNLVQLALISITAGVGEEMLFRGVLQQAVSDRIGGPWGIWVGLAVASAVFGVCHWLTSTYALLAAVTGAYLGLLYIALDGHLAAPIVAHALYDFVALAYLTRRMETRTEKRRPDPQGSEPPYS
jgi:membrane protease YdiL (CAAX protease family)